MNDNSYVNNSDMHRVALIEHKGPVKLSIPVVFAAAEDNKPIAIKLAEDDLKSRALTK